MNPLRTTTRAFTLLELIVVVGLIAALSFAVVGALNTSRGSALQAAQGTLANMLVAARSKATAANQATRLLVNFNPANADEPSRYLRYVVLQVQQQDGSWRTHAESLLPDGVFVVPGNGTVPGGLFAATNSSWTKVNGSALRSTIFQSGNSISEAVMGTTTEPWLCFPLGSFGTTSAQGDLVLSAGRSRTPGSYANGESPVELVNPDEVRGLSVSQYGVATLINSRTSF